MQCYMHKHKSHIFHFVIYYKQPDSKYKNEWDNHIALKANFLSMRNIFFSFKNKHCSVTDNNEKRKRKKAASIRR